MQRIEIPRFGGPEVLKSVSAPAPALAPGSIRVRVLASGVNFADVMMRMGLYPEAPKLPFVPGYEIAGTVSEVAAGGRVFKIGDRVFGGCKFGGYVDEIVLPEWQLRPIPAKLSFAEAAAIPVTFITAWVALMDMMRIRAGDRVLIQSAAGGVGIAALQICRMVGAEAVAQIGSPAKAAICRELGAARVVLNSEWELPAMDGERFDAILESGGGASLKRAMRRLAPGGRVVTLGASTMVGARRSWLRTLKFLLSTPFILPFRLMMENKGVFGLNVLQIFEPTKPNLMGAALDRVIQEFEGGRFRVIVGQIFPLAEAGAAQAYLQSRANIGKVVLVS